MFVNASPSHFLGSAIQAYRQRKTEFMVLENCSPSEQCRRAGYAVQGLTPPQTRPRQEQRQRRREGEKKSPSLSRTLSVPLSQSLSKSLSHKPTLTLTLSLYKALGHRRQEPEKHSDKDSETRNRHARRTGSAIERTHRAGQEAKILASQYKHETCSFQ
jgi:hypothetical protein